MRSCPTQFIVWSVLFLYWYATYVASFLRVFAFGNWYIIVPEFLVFTAIWLLTMSSLAMATFTPPPPIPDMFRIPFELWVFTNTSDATSSVTSNQSTTSSATDPLNARVAAWATSTSLPYSTTAGDGKYNVCCICRVVKPPRTHHCSRCKVCVMRMDHHCPIIGACVHLDNHKFFMQFLFWADMLCLFAAATMIPVLGIALVSNSIEDKMVDWFISCCGAMTAFIFFLVLALFQVSLCWNVCKNITTLEEYTVGKSGHEDHSLGSCCANFQSFFGPPGLAWLFPVRAKNVQARYPKDCLV